MPPTSNPNSSVHKFQAAALATGLWLCVFTGCNRSPELISKAFIEDGVSAIDKEEDEVSKMGREFFADWLVGHGETNVVNDETGVGVADNATRLWAFRFGEKESPTTEVEFRIVLPDGREIVEFVAGMGATEDDDGTSMAMINFCMSTFHTVYSCFINLDDPHMDHEDVTIDGNEFILTSGGIIAFGSEEELPQFSDVSKHIQESLLTSGVQLSSQPHWLKIVYGQHQGRQILASVTLDNEEQKSLTDQISGMPWPSTDGFYMAKEFIVLRPKKLPSP